MAEARENETEEQRRRRQNVLNAAQRRKRRLFQNHDFSTDSYLDVGNMDVECPDCGALHFLDERLMMSTPSNPKFRNCCQKGKFKFPPLSEVPNVLRVLLTGLDTVSREFRKKIRFYNIVLSMASVNAQWVNRAPDNLEFNPTMTVQGRVYHYLGALIPPKRIKPSYASVYVHDTDEVERATIRGTTYLNSSIRIF